MKLTKLFIAPAIALCAVNASAGKLYVNATPKLDTVRGATAEFAFTKITEQLPSECLGYELKFSTTWEPTYKLLMKAAKQEKSVKIEIYHTTGDDFNLGFCSVEAIKYNLQPEE